MKSRFVFAVAQGEFGAARPDRPTVPVVIYQLIARPGAEHLSDLAGVSTHECGFAPMFEDG